MQASPPPTHRRQPPRRLYRTTRDKMVAGVAGGLGEYFDIDPVLVRLIWVAAAVLTGGLAIPAYIVMAIVMPPDDKLERRPGDDRQPFGQEIGEEARRFAEGARRAGESFGEAVNESFSGQRRTTGAPTATSAPSATVERPDATTEPADLKLDEERTADGAETGQPSSASASSAPPSYYASYTPEPDYDAPLDLQDEPAGNRQRVAALVLLGLGLIFLLQNFGIVSWSMWGNIWRLWPLILIAVGFSLIMKQRGGWRS